jgi:hypothetical protein
MKITKDTSNYNKHTPEGMELLKKSVDKFGLIDVAGVLSEDDVLISGNARSEVIQGKDFERQIIEVDGSQAVYLKLKNVKSGTNEFKEIALVSNQVSKKNINIDEVFVIDDLGEEIAEDWGLDIGSEKMELKEEEIKPYKKTHVLISCGYEDFEKIQPLLTEIKNTSGVEYEQSSN